VLRARENLLILLNGEDALPPPRERESNGVAACAGEAVDQCRLLGGKALGEVFGYTVGYLGDGQDLVC